MAGGYIRKQEQEETLTSVAPTLKYPSQKISIQKIDFDW